MEQLIARILALLRDAGLHVMAAMPSGQAPRLVSPACALSLSKVKLSGPGFAQYLGEQDDPELGRLERYGARVEAEATVTVYSPTSQGAAVCMRAVGQALDAFLLPNSGLAVNSLTAEPCVYDARYDHFSAVIRAVLSAWVYCANTQESQRFVDFNLRGELE